MVGDGLSPFEQLNLLRARPHLNFRFRQSKGTRKRLQQLVWR